MRQGSGGTQIFLDGCTGFGRVVGNRQKDTPSQQVECSCLLRCFPLQIVSNDKGDCVYNLSTVQWEWVGRRLKNRSNGLVLDILGETKDHSHIILYEDKGEDDHSQNQ